MLQSTTTLSETQSPFKAFSGIPHLVLLHQQAVNYVQFQLQIQFPLVLDTPKYVKPITEQNKKQLVRKLQMEKRQIQMIKEMLEMVE
jgi:hypothetical protein